jgi:hypothetical protein
VKVLEFALQIAIWRTALAYAFVRFPTNFGGAPTKPNSQLNENLRHKEWPPICIRERSSMTAPVQMTGSTSSAMVEQRGLRRSPNSAKNQSEDVTGTDDTSSPDSSSQAVSSENGDSTDHGSFGAVLRKYFVPPGNGGRGNQSNQVETSQPKKNSVEPDVLATVPVQANEKPREILPLRLSTSLASDQGSTDTAATSSRTSSAHSAAPAATDLAAVIPPGLVPLPQPALPVPAHANPEARSSDITAPQPPPEKSQTTPGPISLTQATEAPPAQATPPQTSLAQTTPGQSSQGPAAPQPEPLAFAVRLAPSTTAPTDEVVAEGTDTSSIRPQTTSQAGQKEIPALDTTPSAAQPADPSAARLAMTNAMPPPVHAPTQSEAVSTTAKNDAHPVLTSSIARSEPVSSPPAAPSSSGRDFTVRIPDLTDRGTNVRFVERGGEVHVSVRTGDAELAQLLRGGLGDLSGRLQHTGVQAEVWRPGSDASHSDSQAQSSDPRDSGGRRNQSGAQRDGEDQPSEDKPRWVEELESFGEPAAANKY